MAPHFIQVALMHQQFDWLIALIRILKLFSSEQVAAKDSDSACFFVVGRQNLNFIQIQSVTVLHEVTISFFDRLLDISFAVRH